jgi:hypothetical protein
MKEDGWESIGKFDLDKNNARIKLNLCALDRVKDSIELR